MRRDRTLLKRILKATEMTEEVSLSLDDYRKTLSNVPPHVLAYHVDLSISAGHLEQTPNQSYRLTTLGHDYLDRNRN